MMCDAIERKAIYPQTEENKSVKKKRINKVVDVKSSKF